MISALLVAAPDCGGRVECGCPPDALSISQIESHALCARRRAWDKIERVPREEKASAARGKEIHDAIEQAIHHQRDKARGAPLDLTSEIGQAALSGAHHWPTDWTATEQHFSVLLGGHYFHGFFDLITPSAVWDWKTTGNLVWAKDVYQLAVNPQVCLYAYARMVHDGLMHVEVRWLYMRSRKPWRCLPPSDLTLSLSDIAPTLDWIIARADEIRAIERSGLRALQLAPNTASCGAFGGCEYRSHCGPSLTSLDFSKGLFPMANANPADMASTIHSMLGGMPPPPNAAATPAPQGLPAGVRTPEQMGWGAPAPGMSYVYDPNAPGNSAGWVQRPSAPVAPAPPQGFNPPPPPQAPPPQAPPPPPVPDLAGLMREPSGAMPPPPAQPLSAAPKKRGRPAKAPQGPGAEASDDVSDEEALDAMRTFRAWLAQG